MQQGHKVPMVRSGAHEVAAIESDLEVIQKQFARLPTRRELAGTACGIIFATMMLTTLSLLVFLP
jgi:tetrahydromethanopterin S-methyltransferase subunit F